MTDRQAAFREIYQDHRWGSASKSGPGSELKATSKYRALLDSVLSSKNISSVVDIGCGDWEFSRTIDWRGAEYTGVDIVPELIDTLNERYGTPARRFVAADLVKSPLPSGDLCVIKDVLQHLSNASIERFLEHQLPKFRFALITNDARKYLKAATRFRPWRRVEAKKPNSEIVDGESRPVDLRAEPFCLKARRLGRFRVTYGTSVFIKEALLWEAPPAPQSIRW